MLHSKSTLRADSGLPLLYGGHRIARRDSQVIWNSLQAYDALLNDLLGDSARPACEDLGRLRSELSRNPDITDLITAISYWADRLISAFSSNRFKGDLPNKGVARLYTSIVGRFVTDFESRYRTWTREKTQSYKHDESMIEDLVGAWRVARQLTVFLTKLDVNAFWAEQQALSDYLSNLKRVSLLSFVEDDPVVKSVATVLNEWLSRFSPTVICPKHGSGSVAEGPLSQIEKDLHLHDVQAIDYLLRKLCVSQELFRPSGWLSPRTQWIRRSRVTFVPKTIRKLRTICMEPAVLQYYQQGVMKCVIDYCQAIGLTRIFDVRNQGRNQRYARQGSDVYRPGLPGRWATIDLSAASDSVSWSLTKALFRRTPLFPWLIATRSKEAVLPNGEIIGLPIFAPMGSALCFPIESLVFAAISESVVRETGYAHVLEGPTHVAYGDDIIVPEAIASRVIAKLSYLGFIVNPKKTFVSGPFRESCGEEYLLGLRTTPIYYTTGDVDGPVTPELFEGLISAADDAAMSGFWLLRSHYVRRLTRRGPDSCFPAFTFIGGRGTIISPNPTNYRLRRRWNVDYQRSEMKVLTTTVCVDKLPEGPLADARGYLTYLIGAQAANADPALQAREIPGRALHNPAMDEWGVLTREAPPREQFGHVRTRYRAKWVDPI